MHKRDIYNNDLKKIKPFLFKYYHSLFSLGNLLEDSESEFAVMFSGGYDSLFNLLALCELKKLGIMPNPIKLITIRAPEPTLKLTAELKAREKIIDFIKIDYGFNNDDLKLSHKCDFTLDMNLMGLRSGYHLQHLYIHLALLKLNNKSNLITGFNSGDDSIILFNNLQTIVDNVDKFYYDADTRLIAPLTQFKKKEIILNLLTYFSKYFEVAWTCESPIEINDEIIPCMNCTKCIELNETLQQITCKDISTKNEFDIIKEEIYRYISLKEQFDNTNDKDRLGL